MFARNCRRLVLFMLLCPGAALALGLGDIHLKSALDAPLSADIEVVDANADDLSTLKATLAPPETFSHFGADYPSFLGTVTFTTERAADGHTVIHVSSSAVANEPFATLLVEADWARGHVVREYTVLLDPPTFTGQAASSAAVTAPTVDSSQRAGNIQPAPDAATAAPAGEAVTHGAGVTAAATSSPTPPAASDSDAASAASGATAAATTTAATASAPSSSSAEEGSESGATSGAPAGAAGAASGTITVKRGDTLSSIAQQHFPSDTRAARDRALVAIYRANPHAFSGNMNVLLAGRQLSLPGDSELVAIGPGEATSEVHQQYESWRGEHGASEGASANGAAATAPSAANGQLRLVAPQQAAQEAQDAQQAAPLGATGAQTTGPSAGPGAGTGSGANANAGANSNAALQQRVQQLQAQLAESQRLLQLQNAQMAAMQARLAQANRPGATAVAPAAPPPTAPGASTGGNVPALVPPPAPAPNPAATALPASAVAPHPPVAPTVPAHKQPKRPVPAHPAAAPNSGNSILDLVREYWYVPVLLLVVLVGLLLAKAVRARQEDAFDRSLGRLSDGPPLEPSAPSSSRSDTLPVRTLAGAREEPSYRVEESGIHEQPVFEEALDEEPPASAATAQHVALEEGPAAEEMPVALDQGDPLAEADFHMAYGLYDQAAELVQNAIAREPKRRDLKLKLLEVFFVWGNKDRFLQSAHELASSREQAPAGEWEKIVIMGRQIAPEDALFTDGRALSGAASGGVDLNLEGGQNRVDFDLLGEPTIGAPGPRAGVDLDLSSALGGEQGHDTDATGEALSPAGSVDFVLDGEELGNDATGSTRKMPGSGSSAAVTREMPAIPVAQGLGDTEKVPIPTVTVAESPTVEQPQLRQDERATIRQKLDAATRHSGATGEQTAELAIDDLGLDLGSLDVSGARAVGNDPNAPTMLAEMDPDSHQVFARAEGARSDGGGAQTQVAAAPAMRATGTWLFTDTDFASMAPDKPTQADVTQRARTELITQIAQPPVVDTSATTRLAALDAADLDLDLSSLDNMKEPSSNGVDHLDVGAAGAETAGRSGADADNGAAALPDLEPVTLSEVGTKLDLARAYMDMGDPEGARSILSEVLSEGSLSQKQEARRLMDALPG